MNTKQKTRYYFPVGGGVGALGLCCGCDWGKFISLALSLVVETDTELLDGPAKNELARLNTKSAMARTQVAFSKKSVVLRTPNIWLDPPNDEVKPPPFESCISTTKIRRMQTITVSISSIKVPMLFIYSFVILFYAGFLQFGPQNKCFFRDFAIPGFHKPLKPCVNCPGSGIFLQVFHSPENHPRLCSF